MLTDSWPEVKEVKYPDMINEKVLLEAKTVIINWIKDLRAQPEVKCSIILFCISILIILLFLLLVSNVINTCVIDLLLS